ncbi:MAG: MarR family transcriptional regulator [Rhizobiales bacterium]|nr:MarR family transcriptional regulator [Hyphomicrobiales bacterium]
MSNDEEIGRIDPSTRAILTHWREAVPNDRLAHLVRDAARGLTRALQFRLSEHGVSFGHWVFLRILWERDGLTQRELSIEAGLMEPTTHSAILKMEKLGYLTRRQENGDRKRMQVYLTEHGRTLRDLLVPLAEEVNAKAVIDVPPEDVEVTRRTLLAMIHNLAIDEAEVVDAGLRITPTRDLAVKSA